MNLYINQLKTVCRFPYVRSFEMVGMNGHSHFMVYATRSIKGLSLMKDAMWKVDPSGNYTFSDRLHGQQILLTADADMAPLQNALAQEFAGRAVSIDEVDTWVLVNTPYCSSHVRRQTLKPMQAAGAISCSGQKRAGTYPPGTEVHFPLYPHSF